MGYTTDFSGHVTITPPLNADEIAYLKRFADTRHMNYVRGPYITDEDARRIDQGRGFVGDNDPCDGQPGLYCQWIPTDDGTGLRWDGGEKFYDSVEWMRYLINVFLRPDAILRNELVTNAYPDRFYADEFVNFTFDHVVNGVIEAQGEETSDHWWLIVKDNEVTVRELAEMMKRMVEQSGEPLPFNLGDGMAYTDLGDAFAEHADESLEIAEASLKFIECRDIMAHLPYDDEEDEEPSYADKVNAPLSEATVAALKDELASGNPARYRKRPRPEPTDAEWDAYAEAAQAAAEQKWNIWSHKHQLWWGPNSKGYVYHQAEAGLYDTAEAVEVIAHSLRGWSLGYGRAVPDSILIPASVVVPTSIPE